MSLNLYTYVENNPLGYADPTGHGGMPIGVATGLFSWGKKKAAEAMNVALKYTVSAYMPFVYDGYNAAVGKNFITGQELSKTQRIINGVAVGLYFIPDFGEAGVAIPAAGRTISSQIPTEIKMLMQQSESNASVVDKLTRYLLNPEHPVGKTKADWFNKALGFTLDNLDDLAKQIRFDPTKAVQTEVTQFGTKYNQVITITGANGKVIDVPFAWIRNTDDVVRLVTGLPAKQ